MRACPLITQKSIVLLVQTPTQTFSRDMQPHAGHTYKLGTFNAMHIIIAFQA